MTVPGHSPLSSYLVLPLQWLEMRCKDNTPKGKGQRLRDRTDDVCGHERAGLCMIEAEPAGRSI